MGWVPLWAQVRVPVQLQLWVLIQLLAGVLISVWVWGPCLVAGWRPVSPLPCLDCWSSHCPLPPPDHPGVQVSFTAPCSVAPQGSECPICPQPGMGLGCPRPAPYSAAGHGLEEHKGLYLTLLNLLSVPHTQGCRHCRPLPTNPTSNTKSCFS